MSANCMHLGCIVQSQTAPGPLHYLKLSLSADGELAVDKQQQAAADVRLSFNTLFNLEPH